MFYFHDLSLSITLLLFSVVTQQVKQGRFEERNSLQNR